MLVRRSEKSLSGARSQMRFFVSILHNADLTGGSVERYFYSSQVIDRIELAVDEQRFAAGIVAPQSPLQVCFWGPSGVCRN
ncbi:hypothetical protein ACT2FY_35025 [Paraburkholderia fungorum]|uniref:hypothetical protein n=1 Tax=Paraburkholderia fungorum TaxID=134537 RepID=UPI00402BB8ED